MRTHRNARTTWSGRRLMVARVREQGWSVVSTADAHGVCRSTVYKWLRRLDEGGEAGLFDRSSAPHSVANRTRPRLVARIETLRRRRLLGRTIAAKLALPRPTGAGVVVRLCLSCPPA